MSRLRRLYQWAAKLCSTEAETAPPDQVEKRETTIEDENATALRAIKLPEQELNAIGDASETRSGVDSGNDEAG